MISNLYWCWKILFIHFNRWCNEASIN